MANTFKVKTNANMPASAGTPLTLYTCPGSTTTIVLGLLLCNNDSIVALSTYLSQVLFFTIFPI